MKSNLLLFRMYLMIVGFSLIFINTAYSLTYYVKNGGNDSANGTSEATAWATVAKVNAYAASPHFKSGDIIQFKRGNAWSNDETLGWKNANYVDWGTINGLTIQDYGTGALPFLNGNTQQPIAIAARNVSNFTLKNIDVSGTEWLPSDGRWSKDFNVKLYTMTNITVDGLYCDGRFGAVNYRIHSGALFIGDVGGNLEIKNCTLKNFYPTTMPQTLYAKHAWSGDDCNGIQVWYEPSADVVKTSGITNIHDNVITNFWADCIAYSGMQSPDGTHIYNNTLSNFGEQAIDIKVSAYVNIHNNDMSHNDFGLSPGGGYEAGTIIGIGSWTDSWPTHSSHDVNVYDNYIHATKMKGILISCPKTEIYRNSFKDAGLAVYINNPSAKIYDNVFNLTAKLYSGWSGIERSAIASGENRSLMNYISIYNNTIYISNADYTYGIGWQATSGQTNNVISKNIIQMTTNSSSVFPLYLQDYDSSRTYPTFDYNNYYNANNSNRISWAGTTVSQNSVPNVWTSTAKQSNYLSVNPLFKDVLTGDFSLLPGSPCILSGITLGASLTNTITQPLPQTQNLRLQ